jgi:tRNA(fMet)-specific endonuclease VapC
MNGRYLLDTNIAIQVLNQEVDLESHRGRGLEVFLSLTVVGELLFGAAKSQQPAANRARVERLIDLCPLVTQDLGTAQRYGTLKADLQKKGRLDPENGAFRDFVLPTRAPNVTVIPGPHPWAVVEKGPLEGFLDMEIRSLLLLPAAAMVAWDMPEVPTGEACTRESGPAHRE